MNKGLKAIGFLFLFIFFFLKRNTDLMNKGLKVEVPTLLTEEHEGLKETLT